MEKIIHFTTSSNPTPSQLSNFEIAKSLHPDWEVKLWSDPVESNKFKLSHYHSKANSGAQLADLIRLDLVFRYGGIYLDSDIVLVKPLDRLCSLESFFCSEDVSAKTDSPQSKF